MGGGFSEGDTPLLDKKVYSNGYRNQTSFLSQTSKFFPISA